MAKKRQFWVVFSVVKKRQFLVVFRVVKKRQLLVVISVVKKGSFGWFLVWLKEAVLGGS